MVLNRVTVRPLRSRAMIAHLLPNWAWAWIMVSSSSGVKGRCWTSGESWLHHRSLQDFPDRPGIDLLIKDQFLGPYVWTSRCKASSSPGLHGPLIRSKSFLVDGIEIYKNKNKKAYYQKEKTIAIAIFVFEVMRGLIKERRIREGKEEDIHIYGEGRSMTCWSGGCDLWVVTGHSRWEFRILPGKVSFLLSTSYEF